MRKAPFGLVCLMGALCLYLTSCSLPSDQAQPLLPEESPKPFMPVINPPNRPPRVTVEDLSVEPAAYEWLIDGKWTSFRAANDPASINLLTTTPRGGTLRGSVDFDVTPAEFIVSFFSDLGPDGTPKVDVGDNVNCLDSDRCSMMVENGRLHFVIRDVDAKIAVIHLGYATVLPENSGKEGRGAIAKGTWGMRLG